MSKRGLIGAGTDGLFGSGEVSDAAIPARAIHRDGVGLIDYLVDNGSRINRQGHGTAVHQRPVACVHARQRSRSFLRLAQISHSEFRLRRSPISFPANNWFPADSTRARVAGFALLVLLFWPQRC